jgi:hypothetical protein
MSDTNQPVLPAALQALKGQTRGANRRRKEGQCRAQEEAVQNVAKGGD